MTFIDTYIYRRGYKKHSKDDDSLSPPPKRVKFCIADEPDISEEEYEQAVNDLQGNQHFSEIPVCYV